MRKYWYLRIRRFLKLAKAFLIILWLVLRLMAELVKFKS